MKQKGGLVVLLPRDGGPAPRQETRTTVPPENGLK